jgi:hypothetical protein
MTRSPLLALAAAALAAGAVVVALSGGEGPEEPRGLDLESSVPAPEAPTRPEEVSTPLVARGSAEGLAAAELEVIVKNPTGVRLQDAMVVLEQEGTGAVLQGTGAPRFRQVGAGAWTLRVEHPEFVSHVQVLELAAGARERLEVRLFENMPVSGRVRDRFGRPLTGRFVWFLRGGESYPRNLRQAEGLLGGLVQATGRFEAELPAEVDLRIVVGRPGAQLWQAPELLHLLPGDPLEADIVVSGVTEVEVEARGVDLSDRDENRLFSIAVLGGKELTPSKRNRGTNIVADPVARQQALLAERQARRKREREERGDKPVEVEVDPENAGAPRGGRLRQQRQDRLAARLEGTDLASEDEVQAARQRTAQRAAAAQEQDPYAGQEWIPLRTAAMPRGGALELPGLPHDRDLRLRLVRRLESLDSMVTFRAVPDATLHVSFDLPPPRTARTAGEPAPPLQVSTWVESLPADAPQAGIRWQ